MLTMVGRAPSRHIEGSVGPTPLGYHGSGEVWLIATLSDLDGLPRGRCDDKWTAAPGQG